MKVVLTKDEAKEYIGFAIVEALYPGRRMRVTEIDWVKYGDEVAVHLEPDPNARETLSFPSPSELASSGTRPPDLSTGETAPVVPHPRASTYPNDPL